MGYIFSHNETTHSEEQVTTPFKPGDKIGAFYNTWNVVSNTMYHMVAELATVSRDYVMTLTGLNGPMNQVMMTRIITDLQGTSLDVSRDSDGVSQLTRPDDPTFIRFLTTDKGLAIEHIKTVDTTTVVELVLGDTIQGKIAGNNVTGAVVGIDADTLWVYVESTKTMYMTDPEQLAEHSLTSFIPAIPSETTPVFIPTDNIIVEDKEPEEIPAPPEPPAP